MVIAFNIMEEEMKFRKLYKYVVSQINKCEKIELHEAQNSKMFGRGKNAKYYPNRRGIYFVFNKNNKIIYVGYIGSGASTSLYDRFKGHGLGSHYKQCWFMDIAYIKYLNLPDFSVIELQKLERVCIKFNKHINYNDKVITKNDLAILSEKILNVRDSRCFIEKKRTNCFVKNHIFKFGESIFNNIINIICLKRFKAYLFSLIFVFLLFYGSFLFSPNLNECEFICNILCSIGASILASVIVGILIDLSDKRKNEENRTSAYTRTKWWISFYTFNLNFELIAKTFGENKVKIDTNRSTYDLFMDAVHRADVTKKSKKNYLELTNSLYSISTYYFRMISEVITQAIYENTQFHHFEDYIIDFMNINQYIEQFLLEQSKEKVVSEVSNVLDLLMNLNFQSKYFSEPMRKHSNKITLYNIYLN